MAGFTLKKFLLVGGLVVLSAAILTAPLVLRFSVFFELQLTLGYQDTIPVRRGMSTWWCENHTLGAAQGFNAFLYDRREPSLTEHGTQVRRVHVRAASFLYWGFFLLRNSRLEVSSCPTRLGTKLLLVVGLDALTTCLNALQDTRTLSHLATSEDYHYLLLVNDLSGDPYNDVLVEVSAWRSVFDRNLSLESCWDVRECTFPLRVGSGQFAVVERTHAQPAVAQTLVLSSKCQPRRMLYFLFYVGFGVIFVIIAFQ